MAHSRKTWDDFLKRFEKTGNVETSCEASGISVTQAYRKRKSNKEFRAAWQHIKEARRVRTIDEIEIALVRRAKGWEETDRHGTTRERFSDAAAKLWLQAHSPAYRDDKSSFGLTVDLNIEAAQASYAEKLKARFEKVRADYEQEQSKEARNGVDQPNRKSEMKRLRNLVRTGKATTDQVNHLYKLSRETRT